MEPKFREAQKVYFIDAEWVIEAYYLYEVQIYEVQDSARIAWEDVTLTKLKANLFLTREEAEAEIKRRQDERAKV